MDEAMVTGRMSAEKKAAGAAVLERDGLNASQAVNLLYDRLISEQGTGFLRELSPSREDWEAAARFVDALAPEEPCSTRFDDMTRGEIKLDRYRSKGLD